MSDNSYEFDTNNHSVFMLNYSLVMCTKEEDTHISDSCSQTLKAIFEDIALNYNIQLLTWETNINFIYATFKGQPNTEISKFINAYKSASSRKIKKDICNSNKAFWAKSFCLVSTGNMTPEVINNYLKKQYKK